MCPCLWLWLPIGKRSGWNIGIAAPGWEDACFSMLCMSPFQPQPQSMLPWQISPRVGIIFSSCWRAFAHPGPRSDPAPAHIYNLFRPHDTYNPLCSHRVSRGCHTSPYCTSSVTGFTDQCVCVCLYIYSICWMSLAKQQQHKCSNTVIYP